MLAAAQADHRDLPVSAPPEIDPGLPFVAPVIRTDKVTSTFGPRWKPNEQRFDFHRGVDFYGALHDPVFAAADGEVHRIYREGNRVYPNGGNTLIVGHELNRPFPLLCHRIEQVFSVYLHLADFEVEQGQTVAAGQRVAGMGRSGNTVFTHLHFEVRLQTTCSLEYQRKNPRAQCAGYGFDPHVHPFLFLQRPPAEAGEAPFKLSHAPGAPFVLQYEARNTKLDLNELRCDLGVLNFNLRTGIDATTTGRLDHFDFGWVSMYPGRFSGRNDSIAYLFEFPEQPKFVQVTDIHGRGLRREFR